MKTKTGASLLGGTLLLVMLNVTAAASDDVGDQLRADYLNKTLTLRHFYTGDHLSFAADGTLIGAGEIGPWSVDGQVLVQSMELRGQSLRIQGRRVCVVFDKDRKDKPYRDVVELIDEKEADVEKRKKGEEVFLNRKVEIEIALGSAQPADTEVKSAMEATFVKPDESLADVLPDYWRDYFDRIEGRPISVPHSAQTVFRVTPGVISPPKVILQPEPAFSEDARRAKYQGTVTLSFVVDAHGKPVDLRITSPLGLAWMRGPWMRCVGGNSSLRRRAASPFLCRSRWKWISISTEHHLEG